MALSGKLTKKLVENLGPGRHGDGNGLYLVVDPSGARRWIVRVTVKGQKNKQGAPLRTDFGLGGADVVTINQARDRALEYRRMAKQGLNPRFNAQREIPTFAEIAQQVHIDRMPTWKNAKHGQQLINTLRDYAFPKIGRMPIDSIGQPEVLMCLSPIWTDKHETARRLSQRIKTVLDVAKSKGLREGENPVTAIKDAGVLPKVKAKPKHHKAMRWQDVPACRTEVCQDRQGETVRTPANVTDSTIAAQGQFHEDLKADRERFRMIGVVVRAGLLSGRHHDSGDQQVMTTNSAFRSDALAGRTAMITGGGSGIGLAIAKGLAAAGANVVLVSRNLEKLQRAASEIEAAGGQALAVAADVREPVAVEAAVKDAVAHFGGLDIMIANAAGNFIVPFADMSFNAWRTVVDIDLHGTFHCAKAAYPHLKASRYGGRFIAISTMRALEGWPGCAHAAAAKAGVISLVRTLALEWARDGILCNTIAPGPIEGTEGARRLYEVAGTIEAQTAGVPLGRLGRAEEVAQAALYLCSDSAGFVTGTDLVVDGGRSRHRGGQPPHETGAQTL